MEFDYRKKYPRFETPSTIINLSFPIDWKNKIIIAMDKVTNGSHDDYDLVLQEVIRQTVYDQYIKK